MKRKVWLYLNSIEQAEAVLFSKFCFMFLFPWLAGRFYNFELTQNRENTRNGSTGLYFLKLSNVSVYMHVLAKFLLITRVQVRV
jgi:hypothetical protein